MVTLPFVLNTQTVVTSAKIILKSLTTDTISSSFNVIPLTLINADNLGKIYNVPAEPSNSFITNFIPGSISNGVDIEIDITPVYQILSAKPGHLPGFIKGFVIEPDSTASESFDISNKIIIQVEYQEGTTGITFKVGVDLDHETGIATFDTRNILFDALNKSNRTVVSFGIYLKKAGFKNQDVEISLADLSRLGIGTCIDTSTIPVGDVCYFIAGSTYTGTFVEGPFPCILSA
jgi:hypothetical protein